MRKSEKTEDDPKVLLSTPVRESLRHWLKLEATGRRMRMQDLVELLIRRERGDLGGGNLERDFVPCPACGVESHYCRSADRFVHADGSENRPCWHKLATGQAWGSEYNPTELERQQSGESTPV